MKSSTYNHFCVKRRVIENAWDSLPNGEEAALAHNFMHLLVPYGAAFWVAVKGPLEDANGVPVFRSAIGFEPRFRP